MSVDLVIPIRYGITSKALGRLLGVKAESQSFEALGRLLGVKAESQSFEALATARLTRLAARFAPFGRSSACVVVLRRPGGRLSRSENLCILRTSVEAWDEAVERRSNGT